MNHKHHRKTRQEMLQQKLQVDKIKNISDYVKTNDLNVNIEIDGGINYETGKICVDAGANILVAGSFLFNQGDLITATNKLSDNFN